MKLLLLSWPHSPHQPLNSLIWQGSISSAPSKESEFSAASRSPSAAPDATWTRVDRKLRLASGPQPWYQEATTCIWVPARPLRPFMLSAVELPKSSVCLPNSIQWNHFHLKLLISSHPDCGYAESGMAEAQAHHTEGFLIISLALPYVSHKCILRSGLPRLNIGHHISSIVSEIWNPFSWKTKTKRVDW